MLLKLLLLLIRKLNEKGGGRVAIRLHFVDHWKPEHDIKFVHKRRHRETSYTRVTGAIATQTVNNSIKFWVYSLSSFRVIQDVFVLPHFPYPPIVSSVFAFLQCIICTSKKKIFFPYALNRWWFEWTWHINNEIFFRKKKYFMVSN